MSSKTMISRLSFLLIVLVLGGLPFQKSGAASKVASHRLWAQDDSLRGTLYFIRGRGIYQLELEDDEERLILETESFAFNPRISPDGRHLLYIMVRIVEGDSGSESYEQLHVYSLEDERSQWLAEYQQINSATWSPDSTQIAIAADTTADNRPNHHIIIINVDGSAPRVIDNPEISIGQLEWADTGDIVFNSFRLEEMPLDYTDMTIINVESGKSRSITPPNLRGSILGMRWRPDRPTELVFVDWEAEMEWGDVWRYDIEAGDLRQFTEDTRLLQPIWSPNGQFVLLRYFDFQREDDFDLYLLNIETGELAFWRDFDGEIWDWVE